MIHNSIKIAEHFLSINESQTNNQQLVLGLKKSFINQTLKSKKMEGKNETINGFHDENRKENEYFKQTSSENCNDELSESEISSLFSNFTENNAFLEAKFSSANKNKNIKNDETSQMIETNSIAELKVDKENLRKVSEELATFELLNLEEADYEIYKEKPKAKEVHKIYSRTLYDSHQHNLSFYAIRENANNNTQITEQIFPESTKNISSQSPCLRNRLSTSPTRMRAQISQHISNFELLKLEAEKLNKSNILINTPGYSKYRPHSGKKEEEKVKYYHNYIFHNDELPCQNRNINRKISHETISSHHKTSNKTMQTVNENKNITENSKRLNIEKAEGNEMSQPRFICKHKKNNSNFMFSKTNNQTEYTLIGSKKNDKNCNKSCSEFYDNRDECENTEKEQKEVNDEEYLISNEFVPFISRSIWDSNRKNIKRISGGVNKILKNGKKFNRTLKESRKEGITTNENINKFITCKFNLLGDHPHNHEKEYRHKRIATSNFFYHHIERSIGLQKNHNVLKETNQNKPNQNLISKSAPKVINQSKNLSTKVSNAEKFYKAQQEKHQEKSQLLVIDPLLKTKAIEMGSREEKKSHDLVIICF